MFLFKKRLHSSQRAERIKRRLVFFSLAGVFLCASALAALSWGSYRGEVSVNTVRVVGAEVVSENSIRALVEEKLSGAYFKIFNRANIFLYPRKSIEKTLLETFPRLANVSLYRVGFREIVVKIEERAPSYLWCGDEYFPDTLRRECFFLDPQGVAFARAPHFSGPVYFEIYGKMRGNAIPALAKHGPPIGLSFLPLGDFVRIIAFKDALAGSGLSAEALVVQETGDALFFFPSGLRLIFQLAQDFGVVNSNVFAALGTAPLKKEFFYSSPKNPYEFLDARFENRIFYK